ncbi:MAG: rhomboid family intramembrane serine protease [Ilumatobacteraceae bacterium]
MSSLPPPVLPSCYRHPNVSTGRSCTRCGRPACAECLVQATVGSHCNDCVRASRPAATVRARDWNARQTNLVTNTLIAINLAVFVWVVIGDTSSLGFGDRPGEREIQLGLSRWLISEPDGWYRLVSAGFLHFGILHLAMNMILLFQLGQMLEAPLGRARFALLYFACLLGGSFGALVIQGGGGGLHGGASGAVFGLMGAAAVGMQRRGVSVFQTGIGATLAINLLLTFTIPGISIGGHVGGVITGAACGFVMLAPSWKPVPAWATWLTPLLAGIIAFVGSVNVAG